MKQIILIVNKRTGSDNQAEQLIHPFGGSYVYLEAEWREKHKQNKVKTAGK